MTNSERAMLDAQRPMSPSGIVCARCGHPRDQHYMARESEGLGVVLICPTAVFAAVPVWRIYDEIPVAPETGASK